MAPFKYMKKIVIPFYFAALLVIAGCSSMANTVVSTDRVSGQTTTITVSDAPISSTPTVSVSK